MFVLAWCVILLVGCSPTSNGPTEADILWALNEDVDPEMGTVFENPRIVTLTAAEGGGYHAYITYDILFTKSLSEIRAIAKTQEHDSQALEMMNILSYAFLGFMYGNVQAGDTIPGELELFLVREGDRWVWR